jgi:hypothetical protein
MEQMGLYVLVSTMVLSHALCPHILTSTWTILQSFESEHHLLTTAVCIHSKSFQRIETNTHGSDILKLSLKKFRTL